MPSQLIGLKAKLYAKKRHSEKVTMKKTIAQHSERDNRHKAEEAPKGAVPHYLLDREQVRDTFSVGVCLARGALCRARCLLRTRSRTLARALGCCGCIAWPRSRIRTHTTEFCFSEAASGLCAESRHH